MKNIMKFILALVVVGAFGWALADPGSGGGGVLKACATCKR
jgi:hypothetical protein